MANHAGMDLRHFLIEFLIYLMWNRIFPTILGEIK